MGFIYKITNTVNGKVYIGQTRNTIAKRFWYHKRDSKTSKTAIYCAMRKYGLDNFIVEQIEECDNSILSEREIYWIAHYKSHNKNFGYNETDGGENTAEIHYKPIDVYDLNCNYIRSFDSIKEASIFYNISQCHVSSCCSKKLTNVKGYVFVYKGEKPNSADKKGLHRTIYQYDLDGNYLGSYKSIRQASKNVGLSRTSLLVCLKGKSKKSANYQWSYEKKNNIGKYEKPKPYDRTKLKTPIFVYDKNGDFIEKCSSIMECSKKYNIGTPSIIYCCKKKPKYNSAKGYQFSYVLEEKKPIGITTSKKIVQQLDFNNNIIREYSSIRETEKYGFDRTRVRFCCLNLNKAHRNYLWRFKEA